MKATAPVRRPAVTARRAGYSVAAVVNAVLLYAVNVQPGWEAVPFLTEDTLRVLPLVNLSLAAGLAVNMIYTVHDPKWVRSLGELVTAVISLAVIVRILQVFPFAFGDASVDWALVARWTLAVAAAGTAIAVIVNFVSLIRQAAQRP